MKRKVFYLMLALLIGGQVSVLAQNQQKKNNKRKFTPEQLMERQTNQMMEALMLDDETAAKFAPVYKDYLKELNDCRMKYRKPKSAKPATNGTELIPKPLPTDEEVEKMITDRFEKCRQILDIREKYYKEFKKILSPRQILKVYQTEQNNMGKIKKELNQRKHRRMPPQVCTRLPLTPQK